MLFNFSVQGTEQTKYSMHKILKKTSCVVTHTRTKSPREPQDIRNIRRKARSRRRRRRQFKYEFSFSQKTQSFALSCVLFSQVCLFIASVPLFIGVCLKGSFSPFRSLSLSLSLHSLSLAIGISARHTYASFFGSLYIWDGGAWISAWSLRLGGQSLPWIPNEVARETLAPQSQRTRFLIDSSLSVNHVDPNVYYSFSRAEANACFSSFWPYFSNHFFQDNGE